MLALEDPLSPILQCKLPVPAAVSTLLSVTPHRENQFARREEEGERDINGSAALVIQTVEARLSYTKTWRLKIGEGKLRILQIKVNSVNLARIPSFPM